MFIKILTITKHYFCNLGTDLAFSITVICVILPYKVRQHALDVVLLLINLVMFVM